ncbi:hypothetical protein Syn7502_03646 (plasmid) [Synechococcus sp. PCC 7502]|uniref:hypothetical protein n=1 Tax=Synechococcus sp. PCC 7502 TaxID=1173263 RepID=UPI00029F80D3|nr:hypothetical protein [Synechococcus sp. PCC 7502]AFY75469.1 hypothetical protein Syn7502_03646 [Synechococcus sp. PCC 7502]
MTSPTKYQQKKIFPFSNSLLKATILSLAIAMVEICHSIWLKLTIPIVLLN